MHNKKENSLIWESYGKTQKLNEATTSLNDVISVLEEIVDTIGDDALNTLHQFLSEADAAKLKQFGIVAAKVVREQTQYRNQMANESADSESNDKEMISGDLLKSGPKEGVIKMHFGDVRYKFDGKNFTELTPPAGSETAIDLNAVNKYLHSWPTSNLGRIVSTGCHIPGATSEPEDRLGLGAY